MAKRMPAGFTRVEFSNGEPMAQVVTSNRRWINKLEALAENEDTGVVEMESSLDGCRDFDVPKELLRLPSYRSPREYSEEQLEASRERLAGVRAEVKARREAEAKKATKASRNGKGKAIEEPEPAPARKSVKTIATPATKTVAKPAAKTVAPAPAKKGPGRPKKVAVEEPEDEEDMDLEVEEEEDEDDEAEEIVVKRPEPRRAKK